jgi:hypothetical protein
MSKEDGFLPDPDLEKFIHELERPLFNYRMSRSQIDDLSEGRRKANRIKMRKSEDEMYDVIRKYADEIDTDRVTL